MPTYWSYWNEYREKSLLEAIHADRYRTIDIAFTKPPVESIPGWTTKDKQKINELMTFLGNYRVKKSKTINQVIWKDDASQFYFWVTNEKGESFYVSAERSLLVINGEFYEIVNGRIDAAWVEKYNQKNK